MSLTVVTQIAVDDDLAVFENLLSSVTFADHLIIYNMERKDKEAQDLFKKYKAKVVETKTPKVVEEIRARQVKESMDDWVLVMDFDEVITQKLAKEIKSTIYDPQSTSYSAFYIPRQNFSLGHAMHHGGWGDDYVVRLFHRESFLDWSHDVHSLPTFKGKSGKINNPMEHHKDASLSQMVTKTNRYSDIEAKEFYEGGLAPVTSFTLLRKLKMEMIRRGILKAGLLDGRIGVIQSIYQGFSVFISYAKLFEMQKHPDSAGDAVLAELQQKET